MGHPVYMHTHAPTFTHTHTFTTKVTVKHKCTQMAGAQFRLRIFLCTFTAHTICPKSSTALEPKSIPDWLCLCFKNTLLGRYSELPSYMLRNRLLDHVPWADNYLLGKDWKCRHPLTWKKGETKEINNTCSCWCQCNDYVYRNYHINRHRNSKYCFLGCDAV
jgi:hypothetical protein